MKISTLRFLLLFVCLQLCCAGIYAQTISVSKTVINPVTGYNQGFGPLASAGATDNFIVSGSNLQGIISVTPPADYEISTDNVTFSSTLLDLGTTGAATTVYVRIKGGLIAGPYNGEIINIKSKNAAAQTVTLSGTVYQPNNDCAGAIALTASSTSSCTTTNGTTQYTNQSSQTAVCGTPDDDVWFSFVAASTSQIITVTGTGSPILSAASIQVFSGNCASLTSLACIASGASVSGLTVGTTYYVRVYSTTNLASGAGQFTICVNTPATLTASPSTVTFATAVCQGTSSSPSTFTVSGSGLSNNVTLTVGGVASSSYTIATAVGGPYSSTLTLTPSAGSVNQTIYVLFTPASAGVLSASISVASSPATTQTVTLTGTGTAGPGTVLISPNSIIDCYNSFNSLTATVSSATATPITVYGTFDGTDPSHWTTGNLSSGGTPANAAWTLRNSTPAPGYIYSVPRSLFFFFNYHDDYRFTSNDNTQFYLSNSSAQGGGTTSTTLTSSSFSTVGYTSLSLNFYQNLRVASSSTDKGEIFISTSPTGPWTLLKTFNSQQGTEAFAGFSGSFFNGTLHVNYNEGMSISTVSSIPPAFLGLGTVYLQFKYTATSGSANWWALDNVTVTGSGGTPPSITWLPITGLYTDATGGTKYLAGTNLSTVYALITGPQTYTATATIGTCTSTGTATVGLSATPIWTGTTSTDWNTLANWCNGLVPTSTTTGIIVPAGTVNSPQLTVNAAVGSIQIDAGAAIDLNGKDFAINGAVTGNGTFTGGHTSTLTANNGANGTIYFTQGILPNPYTYNYLKSLTLNSGSNLTLGDSLNITPGYQMPFGSTSGNVTINSGGALIANVTGVTAGFLTLKSNQFGDAQVAQSSGSVTSANSVSVERYIPAGTRAWRFLSVPFVSSSQTIRDAWQEGATPDPDIYTRNNPNPGFGTQITYAQGTTAFGYDENTTANPSIKTWNASGSSWATLPQSVPANDGTNTPIISYPAYCLFIRGSRNVDLQNAVNATVRDATTLRITGGLRVGPQTINYATAAGTAVLIGNPYAAPIDILTVLSNNSGKFTANKFWVWAPAYSGTDGVGGYLTWSGGMLVPSGTGYTGSHYAQSGQAFMLEATNGGTTGVSFTESCKYATVASVFSATAVQLQKHPAVFTNLMLPSGDSLILVDGVGAGFGDQYSARVDKDDVAKLWNFNENIALVRDSATLAIEHRPIPVLTDTLYYRLYLAQKPYALKIFSQDIPINLPAEAWLVDKYLDTKTAVNLNDTTLYNFTPNTDTNSYRNRFMLVFNRKPVTRADDPGTTGGANSIEVYPNPIIPGGKAMLKLNDLPKGKYEITVINNAGNILKKKTFVHAGGSSTYDIQTGSRWVAGNYVLKITGEDGYSYSTNLFVGK